MSSPRNLAQITATNPATVVADTDLFYMAQAGTTDAGMTGVSIKKFWLPTTATALQIPLSGTNAQGTWSPYTMPATMNNSSMLYTSTTGNVVSSSSFTTGKMPYFNGANFVPSAYTFPGAGVANQILAFATSGNSIGGISVVNNAILGTSATGVPTLLTTLPTGVNTFAVQDNVTTVGTMVPNTSHYADDPGVLTTFTLPSVCPQGALMRVNVVSRTASTAFKIAQLAGQQIYYGTIATTAGTGGSLTSSALGSSVTLECVVANTTFQVVAVQGNLNYV